MSDLSLESWRKFISGNAADVEAERQPSGTQPESTARWRPASDPDSADADRALYSVGEDPALFLDVLETQDALWREKIDDEINNWSETWQRPRLGSEPGAEMHFLFRLRLGELIIEDLLAGGDLYLPAKEPPRVDDQSTFLRWLLIEVWNAVGGSYLKCTAADLQSSAQKNR